jgi:aspartyl-tRNA(Asn)/glutamyl-tRNA(Gln) amidotransferase subunit A
MQAHLLSLAESARHIRAGTLSPVDLVEALLAWIDALEPQLQAWVTLDRAGALDTARRCTAEAQRGQIRGPLHGVPVGIKDIFFTAGLRTTCGSRIFADYVPDYDATAVARLKTAGAIILGKTHTTEFATLDPAPTHNPWHLEHTPGGSSSGSGAAVGVCMVAGALGSQTAGSVLRPAAYCGTVGLKPTFGRISRYGVFPVSWRLDHIGVLTRTVEDAALLLQVLAGHDPHDISSAAVSVPDYLAELETCTAPRLGVMRGVFFERAAPEVRQRMEEVIAHLCQAGAQICDIPQPESFVVGYAAHRIIMRVEAAAVHEDLFQQHRDKYRPHIRSFIESGMLIPSVQYVRAQRLRRRLQREMEPHLAQVDAVLTPTTPTPAPHGLHATGDPVFQTPWTFLGIPALTLPCDIAENGLPLGLQLASAPFTEARLLAVARWCERTLAFTVRPTLVEGALA